MGNNNQRTFSFLRMAVMLGSILVAVAIAYATLNQKANYTLVIAEKTAIKADIRG